MLVAEERTMNKTDVVPMFLDLITVEENKYFQANYTTLL
jgi:hypothetical protein